MAQGVHGLDAARWTAPLVRTRALFDRLSGVSFVPYVFLNGRAYEAGDTRATVDLKTGLDRAIGEELRKADEKSAPESNRTTSTA